MSMIISWLWMRGTRWLNRRGYTVTIEETLPNPIKGGLPQQHAIRVFKPEQKKSDA